MPCFSQSRSNMRTTAACGLPSFRSYFQIEWGCTPSRSAIWYWYRSSCLRAITSFSPNVSSAMQSFPTPGRSGLQSPWQADDRPAPLLLRRLCIHLLRRGHALSIFHGQLERVLSDVLHRGYQSDGIQVVEKAQVRDTDDLALHLPLAVGDY